jgi:outer membrane protein insertion porin family
MHWQSRSVLLGGGRGGLLLGLLCLVPLAAWAGQPPPAVLKITGYGPLGDLKLKRILVLLEESGKKPEFFDANFIEDSALILFSRLNRDGFLKPELTAKVTLDGGRQVSYTWSKAVREHPLPRPLKARRVEFRINKGRLYYFGTIQFHGLSSVQAKRARAYFVDTTALFPLKRTRIYSPDRLERGLSSITEVLNRQGYESPDVKIGTREQNDQTGRVDVSIEVQEGPRSFVRSIQEEYFYGGVPQPARSLIVQTNLVFSKYWLQDFTQQLRATNYHQGYPDTKVEVSQARREKKDGIIDLHLLAQIKSGPLVRLGEVKFTGGKKTKTSVMERRAGLKEGSLLDRILVEEGRYRLARLGVFDSVGLTYEPVDEHTRDVTYQVKEGKTIDASLLFGWGSYELLRGGVEVDQNNLFGLAHHARLLLTQSFKQSYGEYVYTMPELIGRDVDVFVNASALRRQEISFVREEYGGGAGLRKYLTPIATDATVRYSYQIVNATAPELPFQESLPSAGVGSIITELRHDRVDNLLYPRNGYRLWGNFEVASRYFASDVNFQRLELGGSFHHAIGNGHWIHLGFSHGADLTLGSPAQDLPFNRRFFPGGEDSIRGYQQGEAAPRDVNGNVIGAETYLFGSVELEQALTKSWSVVGFFDTVSFAQHLENYPFDQSLYSVGGGLSWKTIIGPVRLEYGYNLNRRPHDPVGTVQFSVGFPF